MVIAEDEGHAARTRVARLSEDCVRAVGLDGGSVALVSEGGDRVVESATDAVARFLEEVHLELGEGPYVDAFTEAAPVLVADLQGPLSDAGRWPFFAPRAAGRGVRAVFAFPISVDSLPVGTIGFYRSRPGGLDPRRLGLAMSAVDDIAQAILDEGLEGLGPRAEEHDVLETPRLDGGAGASTLLHQAAGMVVVQADVTISEALALLRATAFAEGVPLAALARDVVERRRRLGEET